MTATVLNTALALPAHVHTQAQIGEVLQQWLAHDPDKAARARSILAHAEIDRRYTVRPLAWYLAHTSLSERSAVYREEMVTLCERAVAAALEAARMPARAVGLLVTVSCTGIMIPSVDAHLMNRLPFAPTTRRLPITEMGCQAGATALRQAYDHLRAYPKQAVVVVAGELASLTAQVDDFSMANVVSGALFGDGVAATVLAGEGFSHEGNAAPGAPDARPPARVHAVQSVHFADTLDMMGFEHGNGGLRIFLSPRLPRFVRDRLPQQMTSFLADYGLSLSDVHHFLLHPGGRKVIDNLEQQLGLSAAQTALSRRVLREYGNLSSATVLYILHHFEREVQVAPGDWGLLMAVGPGFSAEMVLLRW